MAATPRNLEQWALDVSMSEFGSPYSDGTSFQNSSSTLQYINSQLIAHGFTKAPGLSLDELSNAESEKLVKCILGMLSQRVEDMSRTEELSTKFKTLSYDHERLISMNKAANEKAANAEREMNMHKSRLASANRALQSAETAHKHTTAELQRTRVSLQAIRLTHQSELKRKEKEIERMVEKWSKICDTQLKLGSGLAMPVHGNAAIVEGSEWVGRGQGYLEIALEQAEKSRTDLAGDNVLLRRMIVDAVNDVQSVLHLAKSLLSEQQEEPAPFTQTELFPLHPQFSATDKLTKLLGSLRESLAALSRKALDRSTPSPSRVAAPSGTPHAEISRLQKVVDGLRVELDHAHKESAAQAEQVQILFDQVHAQNPTAREAGNASIDLMIGPAQDEERQRIEATKKGLEEERRKFTEAAVKLGREKAVLEAERIRFLDEKRSWQVEQMLSELPQTPAVTSTQQTSPIKQKVKSSPRKSPRKAVVGKAGSGRKIRVSRRSSSGLGLGERLQPSFETEVMPPDFPVITAGPTIGAGMITVMPPPPLSIPSSPSFVIPPPSPHSSLPRAPALLGFTIANDILPAAPRALEPEVTTTTPVDSPPDMAGPSTPPPARKFPVAKPFAPRMIHAYSPAKPSPLSRILMMNSPASPPDNLTSLNDLVEEDEHSPTTVMALTKLPAQTGAAPHLAVGLSTEESPLREKPIAINAERKASSDNKPFAEKDKGKGKADSMVVKPTRSKPGSLEKENKVKSNKNGPISSSAALPSGTAAKAKSLGPTGPIDVQRTAKITGKPASSSTTKPGLKLGAGTGGPRRVPIQSSAAARGWKG
ncbi:hypothetical protein HWV62_2621 [Athelia sp. TMB]|nr:hypothetical protein HWV62_2621 [Athelia sp. TMB]